MYIGTAAGVSDSWILEEKRLMEVQKGRLGEDVKRSHVVEDRRRHPYVPEPKAKERHMVPDEIDEWFILLEPVSKKSGKEIKNLLCSLSHLSLCCSDFILISSL